MLVFVQHHLCVCSCFRNVGMCVHVCLCFACPCLSHHFPASLALFCSVACLQVLSFLFTHSSRSKVASLVKNTDKLADAQHELEARGEEDQALKLKAEEVKDKVKVLREAVEKAKVLVAQTKYFLKDAQQKKQVALLALQHPSQRH